MTVFKNSKDFFNAFGTWKVTTEGDVEGRSTRQLGVFTGYVDEIAFHLADQAFYKLEFEPVPDPNAIKYFPKKSSVNVSFSIESNTWNMSPKTRTKFWSSVIMTSKSGLNTKVEDSQYHASAVLTIPEDQVKLKEFRKQEALAKLTTEEKQLLGLE